MQMHLATLTSKGQLTIPVAIRDKLNLKQGDKVVFLEDDLPERGVRILNATALTFDTKKEAIAIKG